MQIPPSFGADGRAVASAIAMSCHFFEAEEEDEEAAEEFSGGCCDAASPVADNDDVGLEDADAASLLRCSPPPPPQKPGVRSSGRAHWNDEETESLLHAIETWCRHKSPDRPAFKGLPWEHILAEMHSLGYKSKTIYHIQKKYQNICWSFRKLKSWRLRKCLPLYEELSPGDRYQLLLPRRFCPQFYARMEAFFSSTGIDDGVHPAMRKQQCSSPLKQRQLCKTRNRQCSAARKQLQQDGAGACNVGQDRCKQLGDNRAACREDSVTPRRSDYELRERKSRGGSMRADLVTDVSNLHQFLAAAEGDEATRQARIHNEGNDDCGGGGGGEEQREHRGSFHDMKRRRSTFAVSGSHDDEQQRQQMSKRKKEAPDEESERMRGRYENQEQINGGGVSHPRTSPLKSARNERSSPTEINEKEMNCDGGDVSQQQKSGANQRSEVADVSQQRTSEKSVTTKNSSLTENQEELNGIGDVSQQRTPPEKFETTKRSSSTENQEVRNDNGDVLHLRTSQKSASNERRSSTENEEEMNVDGGMSPPPQKSAENERRSSTEEEMNGDGGEGDVCQQRTPKKKCEEKERSTEKEEEEVNGDGEASQQRTSQRKFAANESESNISEREEEDEDDDNDEDGGMDDKAIILQHVISMDKHLSDFMEAVKMNMRILNSVVKTKKKKKKKKKNKKTTLNR